MSKKFNRLAEHVTREYESEGVSPETARKWGVETAGKVYEEKRDGKGDDKSRE